MRKPNESIAEYNARVAATQQKARGGGGEGFGNWLSNEAQYWGGQLGNTLQEANKPVYRGPLGPQVTPPAAATPKTDRLDRDERALKPFVKDGINPRTGLPWDESPGKSPTKPGLPPEEPTITTNQRTTTNPNGVEQTMTNTGAINMPGLAELERYAGGTIANFGGPSFPTQQETNKITDGYSFTASEFLTAPKNEDGSAFEVAGVSANMADSSKFAANGPGFNPANYREGAAGDVAGLDGFKAGGKFAGAPTATEGLGAATSDSSGLRYDASKYKGNIGEDGPSPMDYATSSTEMRRRSAFLNSGDSLAGSRAVNRGLGGVRVGGDIVVNNGGTPTKIDSDKWREIRNAAPGEAQALKDKWVKSLSASQAEEPQTASSAQNPTESSGTSTFNEDMKQDLTSAGKAVDYLNNNAEDDLSYGSKRELNKEAFGMTGATNQTFDNNDVGKFYLK